MLNTELFLKLEADERYILEQNITTLKFGKNANIFQGQQKINGIYVLQSGTIKRYIHGIDNRECVFDIIGPGDLFGHRVLFTRDDYFDSATALTEAEVQYLPKEIFLRFLKSNVKFMEGYIGLLSTESINYVQKVQMMGQLSLRSRVAYAMLYIQSKNPDPTNMTVAISREDLANFLGTVKESVVRILFEFKEKGWLSSSGRAMEILAPDKFKEITQTEKMH